jgi:hypothetical protein
MLSVCPVSLLKGEGIEFVRLKSRNSFGTPVLFSEVNYGRVAVIATKLLETHDSYRADGISMTSVHFVGTASAGMAFSLCSCLVAIAGRIYPIGTSAQDVSTFCRRYYGRFSSNIPLMVREICQVEFWYVVFRFRQQN